MKRIFKVLVTTCVIALLGVFNLKAQSLQDLSIDDAALSEGEQYLKINPEGLVVPISLKQLRDQIYGLADLEIPCDRLEHPAPPHWTSQPGIMYTGVPCRARVGINNDDPQASLHVGGGNSSVGLMVNTNYSIALGLVITDRSNIYNAFSVNGDGQLKMEVSSATSSLDMISIVDNQNNNLFKVNGLGQLKMKVASSNEDLHMLNIVDEQDNEVFRVTGSGTVVATEYYARLKNNFPDYVFEEDYQLMSLSDLENYISKNKHLPNMPTAAEVEEKGMELSELVRVQTEKIEELTLYVIQLKRELDVLQLEIR
jgi:hypothetical protein